MYLVFSFRSLLLLSHWALPRQSTQASKCYVWYIPKIVGVEWHEARVQSAQDNKSILGGGGGPRHEAALPKNWGLKESDLAAPMSLSTCSQHSKRSNC